MSSNHSHNDRVHLSVDQSEETCVDYTEQTAKDLIDDIPSISPPTQTESQQLLERFLLFLGVTQHFFDPRVFTDSMTMHFRSSKLREEQKRSVWYTKYLLVMAVAKLIANDESRCDNKPPGIEYFAEAVARLQPLSRLRESGVESVEILGLATLYLSWCDKPYEGYFYVRAMPT
jgi:proline utilization trans-activator